MWLVDENGHYVLPGCSASRLSLMHIGFRLGAIQ
ncbi:Hypothetical protein BCETI_7000352 [Brucella ceti str. Cudo]|uniref:Uncharacterized protein n=1 Tax=Brucella ceti str. Cudo TaxID=595497 RepID=C0GAN3_9HYPH|nr:Hypothetical protein BCETI_7000352 [Brucella ceti str. Cudo]